MEILQPLAVIKRNLRSAKVQKYKFYIVFDISKGFPVLIDINSGISYQSLINDHQRLIEIKILIQDLYFNFIGTLYQENILMISSVIVPKN